MNNSFPRLIDGMCATLRTEVLSRLDDEFARGQVFGVINLLNTFKVRADWAGDFLLAQLAAQRQAIEGVRELLAAAPASAVPALPDARVPEMPSIDDLIARRDEGNRALAGLQAWLDNAGSSAPAELRRRIETLLRGAMRAEVDIEVKYSPRPLFAEMSSGRET
jgi:hypothetical protein